MYIRFFRKTEGAISIFLCIILLAMMLLAGVLIEGTRMKSAESQIEGALDSSSKSALANYNNLLKDMYGLMAISDNDPEKLKDEIMYYLERNLMAYGIDEHKTAADSTFDKAKGSTTVRSTVDFFGFNGRDNMPSLDLYSYKIEELNIQPIYNLSEPEVLRAQILEYMKYRGPKELAEGLMDKFLTFKDFKKQADILSQKLDVDKELSDIKKNQVEASQNMTIVNKFGTDFNIPNQLEIASGYIKTRVTLEKAIGDLKSKIEEYKEDIHALEDKIEEKRKAADSAYKEAKKAAEEDKKVAVAEAGSEGAFFGSGTVSKADFEPDISEETVKIDDLKERISDLTKEIGTKAAEMEGEINSLKDINNMLATYITKHISATKTTESALATVRDKSITTTEKIDEINGQLKGEVNEFSNTTRVDMGGKKEKISTKDLNPKIDDVDNNKSVLETIKAFIENAQIDTLKLSDFGNSIPDIDEIRACLKIEQVKSELKGYKGQSNYNPVDYYVDAGSISNKKGDEESDPRKVFSDFIKGGGPEDSKKIEPNKKEMPESVPSKGGIKATAIEEMLQDREYIEQMLKFMSAEEYTNNEMFEGEVGEFKDVNLGDADFSGESIEFSKDGLSVISMFSDLFADGIYKLRDEIYIDEYIMGSFANSATNMEEDLDLRGGFMKDRPVYFDKNNADVEYILWGNDEESENINAVKTQLSMVRFALNAIAIYTDPYKFNIAMQIATVVASWTMGAGVPIVHTLIMLGWAMVESLFDVDLLFRGESVPIFKTRSTWITSPEGLSTRMTEDFFKRAEQKTKEVADNVIDYTEDKISDRMDNAKTVLTEHIDSKIDLLVDKAFANIENPVREGMHSAEEIFNDFKQSINVKLKGDVGEIINQIGDKVQILLESQIYNIENGRLASYAPNDEITIIGCNYLDILNEYKDKNIKEAISELNAKIAQGEALLDNSVEETSKKVNSLIFNTIEATKFDVKNELKAEVSELTECLNNKFSEALTTAANEGKEKVNELINSIGNTSDTGVMKTNLKASFLSMKYPDYLRLFLLFVNEDKKMERIADLIQLNMRAKSGDGFRMSECSTYMRVETKVSIKYLFLSQPFIPKKYKRDGKKRIQFDVALYKGY